MTPKIELTPLNTHTHTHIFSAYEGYADDLVKTILLSTRL